MNSRLYLTGNGATAIEPIEELSRVSIRHSVETEGGILPAGSRGTVVSVYGSGEAYCVEFASPFHALTTLSCSEVVAVPGEDRQRYVGSAREICDRD